MIRGKPDNNRVVAEESTRALDIWGPSLPHLQGEIISHKAEIQDEIATLNKQIKADQTMLADLIFVNSLPYLIIAFKP